MATLSVHRENICSSGYLCSILYMMRHVSLTLQWGANRGVPRQGDRKLRQPSHYWFVLIASSSFYSTRVLLRSFVCYACLVELAECILHPTVPTQARSSARIASPLLRDSTPPSAILHSFAHYAHGGDAPTSPGKALYTIPERQLQSFLLELGDFDVRNGRASMRYGSERGNRNDRSQHRR